MHIVTGLSKELLPPSGEVQSGGDGSGTGIVPRGPSSPGAQE